MYAEFGVPEFMGEFEELFLCNWKNGFVEDFHARYYNKLEMNKHYEYQKSTEMEMGFCISNDEIVRGFCYNCTQPITNALFNCLMASAFSKQNAPRVAFHTVHKILRKFKDVALAFVFSSNWMLSEGTVLYRNGSNLQHQMIKKNFNRLAQCHCGGELHLCVIQMDNSIHLVILS